MMMPETATATAEMECRICGHVDVRDIEIPITYFSRTTKYGLEIEMDLDMDVVHDAPCPNCGANACEPRQPLEWEGEDNG
ncbi:MAG TPA: hypothetical protein VMY35_04380 [Phycisphaerae bacterium]|nr:hypothetical protein [Phycisphaerae bacterium]